MLATLKNKLKTLLMGNHLPCFVISKHPFILISYFHDFFVNLEEIAAKIEEIEEESTVFFQLGWHVETVKRIEEIEEKMELVQSRLPQTKFIFLTNSPNEEKNLKQIHVSAEFCHQNAFLDEKRYPIYKSKKKFDAIYLARITPFKRHELARDVRSLKLIGDHKSEEEEYFQKVMKLLQHAEWQRKIAGTKVSRAFAQAYCGLCLSGEEGAMFVSTEYLLSGITIVTTPNLGGRNHLIPQQFMKVVSPNPKAVAEAVKVVKETDYPAEDIRKETLMLMQPHREKFLELVNEIRKKNNVEDLLWHQIFIHKFGLRTSFSRTAAKRMLQA